MWGVRVFPVFSFLWAVQALEEKSDRILLDPSQILNTPSDIFVVLSALCLVFRPSSLDLFMTFVVASLVNYTLQMPDVLNHIMVAGACNLCFVFTLLQARLQGHHSTEALKERLVTDFWPLARSLVVATYYFALFQKLNIGFFTPEGSCSFDVLLRVATQSGVFDWGLWISPPQAMLLTVALELSVPTFLLIAHLRWLGLALGVGFHGVLGLVYPSFSTLIFILYLSFLPLEVWASWIEQIKTRTTRHLRYGILAALLPLLAVAFFTRTLSFSPEQLILLRYAIVTALVLPMILVVVKAYQSRHAKVRANPTFRKTRFALLTVVFVQFLGPYLGYKTAPAFSMYSNLRTEITSNHLIVPKGALQLFDEQDDLVEIVEADRPPFHYVAALNGSLPLFELQRQLHIKRRLGETEIPMVVRYRGEILKSDAIEQHPLFGAEPSWIKRKLMSFRPVFPESQNTCTW